LSLLRFWTSYRLLIFIHIQASCHYTSFIQYICQPSLMPLAHRWQAAAAEKRHQAWWYIALGVLSLGLGNIYTIICRYYKLQLVENATCRNIGHKMSVVLPGMLLLSGELPSREGGIPDSLLRPGWYEAERRFESFNGRETTRACRVSMLQMWRLLSLTGAF